VLTYGAALIFISLDLSLHCETTDTELMHHALCLFMPHGRAELVWLVDYILRCSTSLCQGSPIQVQPLIMTIVY